MADETLTARKDPDAPPVVGPWTLWFAVLGGLGAWIARLIAGAMLVGYACGAGWMGMGVLWLLSAAAGAVALGALGLCRRIRRRANDARADTEWRAARFAATVGILMNAISLVLIGTESLFLVFIDPCISL